MTRQFSLGTVFRMTEKSLLRSFFESFRADVDHISWSTLKRNDIAELQAVFDGLPPSKRDEAEIILRYVHSLACEQGMEELTKAAETIPHDDSWNNFFQSEMNLYSKAFTAWFLYHEIFEHAVQFWDVDSRTWWRKRLDLPKITPQFDINTRNRIEQDITDLLKTKQGRGYVCTVEMIVRPNGSYYFFAYPDDYVRDTLVHDEDKLLVHQTIRQTFEVVFVYDSIVGTSELSAKLPKPIKEVLEAIFLKHLLGIEPPEEKEKLFDLSILLDPNFDLTVSPEDNIQTFVTGLTYNWGSHYTVEHLVDGSESVREFSLERLGEDHLNNNKVVVKKARFRFVFVDSTTGKSRTMTFHIAPPFICTLKNQQPEQVEMAHRYLKQWRIEHAQDQNPFTTGSLISNTGRIAGRQTAFDSPAGQTLDQSATH